MFGYVAAGIRLRARIWLGISFLVCRPSLSLAHTTVITSQCQNRWSKVLSRQEKHLFHTQKRLQLQFSEAQSRLWLPKSPQLRGRLDQELDDLESRGRFGLRWHLPRFSSLEPPNETLHALRFSEEKLPELWIDLKRYEILVDTLRADLQLRESWLDQVVLMSRERLSTIELQLYSTLVGTGMDTSIRLQMLKSKHRSLQLKRRRATRELRRQMSFLTEYSESMSQQEFRSTNKGLNTLSELPLATVIDCLSASALKTLHSSLSISYYDRSPPQLSLEEIELVIQQVMRRFKAQASAHQWVDFVELSYDGRVGAERIIAEIGINLPWGPNRSKEDRLSISELREAARQIRQDFERQRRSLSQLLSVEDLKTLSEKLNAQPMYEVPKTLDEIKLAQAKIDHWYSRWRDRLHIEQLVLEWLTLHPSLSLSSVR